MYWVTAAVFTAPSTYSTEQTGDWWDSETHRNQWIFFKWQKLRRNEMRYDLCLSIEILRWCEKCAKPAAYKESGIGTLFLEMFWHCFPKIIRISPCLSKLQLVKLGTFFQTQCISGYGLFATFRQTCLINITYLLTYLLLSVHSNGSTDYGQPLLGANPGGDRNLARWKNISGNGVLLCQKCR